MTSVATAQQIIAQCDDVLSKRLEDGEAIVSFTLDGQVVTKHGFEEILRVKNHYEAIVRRSQRGGGVVIGRPKNR
ncbi:MAG: hypothetical protein ACPGQD_03390 [Planctomycetota bacterium]